MEAHRFNIRCICIIGSCIGSDVGPNPCDTHAFVRATTITYEIIVVIVVIIIKIMCVHL